MAQPIRAQRIVCSLMDKLLGNGIHPGSCFVSCKSSLLKRKYHEVFILVFMSSDFFRHLYYKPRQMSIYDDFPLRYTKLKSTGRQLERVKNFLIMISPVTYLIVKYTFEYSGLEGLLQARHQKFKLFPYCWLNWG